ncbi:hypothetical protein [Lentzea sp. NPDC051838]|uniref:hypothetical protein n=1 Tax=Lentzea sp. NPDC051838 TaxID=3154849 RepID=UPI0034348CF4
MKRFPPVLGALVLVAVIVGYVVWQRPAEPPPPPAPRKDIVLQYSDGSKMWGTTGVQYKDAVVTRVFAELAEASLSEESLRATGAVVRTTIKAKEQTLAAAVLGRLVAPQRTVQAAVTAIDPASGGVRVYLPGFGWGDDVAGERLEPGPGLVLAGENVVQARVSALDVSATYATFGAGGVKRKTHFVAEVTAEDGKTLHRAPDAADLAYSGEFVDQLTARLKENPACNGIACAPSPYAAEPGKVQHAWIAGYTPQLAVTVLVKKRPQYGEEQADVPVDADLPRVVWQEFLAELGG